MPRPLRIEYAGAYYHVMNRGRRREKIFETTRDYQLFLSTLSEAHQRFEIQVISYCLMPNHYHLLIKTPQANLGRAMRHINGVYTQRFNRLRKTDGALFKGRYKAIVIEEDSYQQQVSRYIHLNPVEAKIVKNPGEYPWSSYRDYLQPHESPGWLYSGEILTYFSGSSKRYQAFVELGVDEEIKNFYGKGNIMPYLGSEEFREWAFNHRNTDEQVLTHSEKNAFKRDINTIIKEVADLFAIPVDSILASQRGKTNIPRWAAMYICQVKADHRLLDIAKHFGLKRTGSIPNNIAKFRQLMEADKLIKNKINQYDI